MLQIHNTVVNTIRFSLTRLGRFTSLCIEKAGFPHSRPFQAEKVGRLLMISGMGLMLGACAVIERAELDEAKQQVSERAQQRWDLVVKGQMDQAYLYLSPASRATLTFDAFRKRTAPGRWWRKMHLEKVDCRPDDCQVTMALEYDLFEIKGLKASVEETWIKDAGTWWLVAGK